MTRRLSLAGSLGWFLGSYSFAIAGYFAVNALSARILGPESFGRFAVSLTLAQAIGQLSLLGVNRAGLRDTAIEGEDASELRRQVWTDVRTVRWLVVPTVSVAVGVPIAWWVGLRTPADLIAVGAVSALLCSAVAYQQLWASLARGIGMVRMAGLLEGRSGGALVAVLQALLLGLVALLLPSAGLPWVLAAMLAGFVIPTVVAQARVVRSFRPLFPPDDRSFASVSDVFGRNWRFVSVFSATSLNSNAELWIAGIALSAVQVSSFGSATRLALLLALPVFALQTVFGPVISRMWSAGSHRELQDVMRTGATFALLATGVAALPLLVAPTEVLRLVFGSGYSGAADLLVILSLGSLVNVATGICGAFLLMTGHEGALSRATWVTVLGRLAVGLLAMSLWGVTGLAVSAAVMTVLLNSVKALDAYRLAGMNTLPTLRPKLSLLLQARG